MRAKTDNGVSALPGMDSNLIFQWIVGASCVISLVRLVRLRSAQSRGWIFINLILLCVLGAGVVLFPEHVGSVAFGFWSLVVLIPGIGSRLIQRWVFQQQFSRARRLSIIVCSLHPFDGWRQQPELIRALELAYLGDVATATKLLEHHQNNQTALGFSARAFLCRLTGQWEQFLQWIDTHPDSTRLLEDPSLLSGYIRALGETGALSRLVAAYRDSEKLLTAPALAALRATCRLMVLAFFGRRQAVDTLFQGALHSMHESHKQFWQATADMASGEVEPARERLRELKPRCDVATQAVIDRRLSTSLAVPSPSLMADAAPLLHHLEQEIGEEARFGEHHAAHGRATASLLLIAANIFGFVLEMQEGGITDGAVLFRLGAVQPAAVLQGEQWRIITAQFLHFGYLHLILNMVGLLWFGRYLEYALGRARYLGVYFASGTGAMALLVLLNANAAPNTIVVGASGGVLGLLGATAALMLVGWKREGARLAKRRLLAIAFMVAIQALSDFMIPQASFTAHLSGAVIGLLVTLLLPSREAATARGITARTPHRETEKSNSNGPKYRLRLVRLRLEETLSADSLSSAW